ncbi:bifunctional DNA primase/polymerase [Bifidobacterium dentium]|uniref:Bifunctional DNA primase/polymerase n=1 Tax=Bifidobacterium dentium (strain ATCC 27534 / DSM 20436 / JCM 1195 / Bd1) TaxID=401473 RepID=D2QB68_BIFDB|nr:bifunctional DNA primase/polymerase [Bifidobacterium dentium]ADB10054.1 bifunctional DNA primase/polymerase [Bifidobacterium dentium Bd1]SEC61361.1 Bifunctional DNA primase/polymerase, N-terminal [Bifidobacterium dentium JCM 1195 = DSM 20436]VEG24038.1 bifunctional DNA primase/polymerase [Bifidobacterium dentium]
MNITNTIPLQATTIDTAVFERVRDALLTVLPHCKTTAHRNALENAVRNARPTNDLAANPGFLHSVLQGEREDAAGVDMPGDPKTLSPGEIDALAEALVGDLRVLPAQEDGRAFLFRRAYDADGYTTTSIPASWVPLGSPEAFYNCAPTGGPRAHNLKTPLVRGLLAAGQEIHRGVRITATDGVVAAAYYPAARAYRLWQCRDGIWYRTEGEGQGIDGGAEGITGRAAVTKVEDAAELEFLSCPLTLTESVSLSLEEVIAVQLEAAKLAGLWTDGSADAMRNLMLCWGAPIMSSHPEKLYWLSGQGGTGKSQMSAALVRLYGGTTASVELLAKPGSMSAENLMYNLQKANVGLFDEVGVKHFDDYWPAVKTLCTGLLPFSPRRRGEDASADLGCRVTPIFTANVLPPLGQSSADQRRACIIAMTGRGWPVFRELRDAGRLWALALAGALEWVLFRGQHAASSVWVDAEGLSAQAVAVVQAILESEPRKAAPEGYVRASDIPHGVQCRALGLVRKQMRQKGEGSKDYPVACWLPAAEGEPNRALWLATVAAVKSTTADDGEEEPPLPPLTPMPSPEPVTPSPTPAPTEPDDELGAPIDDLLSSLLDEVPASAPAESDDEEGAPIDDLLLSLLDDAPAEPAESLTPTRLAEAEARLRAAGVHGQIIPCVGGADYAEAKRPLVSWKAAETKAEAHPDKLERFAPVTSSVAAIVLSPKQIAVDLDIPKGEDSELPEGEALLARLVPEAFDAARAVITTGSGGRHLIFDAPAGLEFVNRAHPLAGRPVYKDGPTYANGVPIDLRTSRGYVVMAGSEAAGRAWSIDSVTSSPLEPHPMPPSLVDLLDRLGFVRHEDRAAAILADFAPKRRDPFMGLLKTGNGQPDLSPVAEGSRNDTIHAQCYGRHVNHADECARIDRETMQRAQASGLPEDEARSIIHSVHRTLGLGA